MSTWDCIDPEKETVHMNIIMWSIFSIQQTNLWYDTMLTTQIVIAVPPHPVVQAVPARWATSTINPVKSFRACGATTLQTKVNVKFVNGTKCSPRKIPNRPSSSHIWKSPAKEDGYSMKLNSSIHTTMYMFLCMHACNSTICTKVETTEDVGDYSEFDVMDCMYIL